MQLQINHVMSSLIIAARPGMYLLDSYEKSHEILCMCCRYWAPCKYLSLLP